MEKDKPRCCGRVFRGHHYCGCYKNATAQLDGKWYCGTHNPAAVERRKAKQAEQDKARMAQWNAKRESEAYNRRAGELCRQLGLNTIDMLNTVTLCIREHP